MNIIKRTPCFSGFVLCHLLVACCSMMVTGEAHCRVYDLWLSWIYEQTIACRLDLLKYCNIDILTLILMQNKLKCISYCCTHLILQKWGIGKKKLVNCWDSPNKVFFLSKFFTVRYFKMGFKIWKPGRKYTTACFLNNDIAIEL